MKSPTMVIVTSAFLLCNAVAHAKCKYEVDTVNVTTGEKVMWSRWEGLQTTSKNGGPTLRGAAATEGDNRYLVLKFDVYARSEERPKKNDLRYRVGVVSNQLLLVHLANNEVLRLPVAETVFGDTNFTVPNAAHESPIFRDTSRTYKINTSTVAKYVLSADDIAKLATNKVTDVHIRSITGEISFDFKRGTNDVQKLMECFQ